MAKGKGKGKAKAAPKKTGRKNIRAIRDPPGFNALLAAAHAIESTPASAAFVATPSHHKRETAIIRAKRKRFDKTRDNCIRKSAKKCRYVWNKKMMKAHERMNEYLSGKRTRKIPTPSVRTPGTGRSHKGPYARRRQSTHAQRKARYTAIKQARAAAKQVRAERDAAAYASQGLTMI